MSKEKGLNPDFFIEPEKIIKNIAIELLQPHPQQAGIYGEDVIDNEFVASIRDKGILTPLTVTPVENGFYTIISGHRRKKGALLAGLSEVPCVVKKYENDAEMEFEFLTCNMQREKTKQTRIMEFFRYKQILCQIGKLRKSKGVYDNTIFNDNVFSRILENDNILEKIEAGKPLNSVDVLKKVTGYSKYEQEQLYIINDDNWIQLQVARLEGKAISGEDLDKLWNEIWAVREEFNKPESKTTMNTAVKQIKEVVKNIEEKLDKEYEKKHKLPKLKKDKIQKQKVKKEDVPSPGLLLNIGGQTTFSETPLKFVENQSVIDYCFKADKFDFGVARTMNSIVGFAVHYENKNYLIKPEMLAKFIQKELSQNEKAN